MIPSVTTSQTAKLSSYESDRRYNAILAIATQTCWYTVHPSTGPVA